MYGDDHWANLCLKHDNRIMLMCKLMADNNDFLCSISHNSSDNFQMKYDCIYGYKNFQHVYDDYEKYFKLMSY